MPSPIPTWQKLLAYGALAVAAFHLAYEFPAVAFLITLFLLSLFRLAWLGTPRLAFWTGLALGLAAYAPQLAFFWRIFGPSAIALWLIAALALALFLLLARWTTLAFPRTAAILVIPVLWTGIEYFRSELYYLRFAWLTPGLAFPANPLLDRLGVYGIAFLLMALIAILHFLPRRWFLPATALLLAAVAAASFPRPAPASPQTGPLVVGLQTESFGEKQILQALDHALEVHPDADLLILSEYAFAGELPPQILHWCSAHKRYLIAGGMQPAGPGDQFRDTAFVVDPAGRIVFSQAKCVPIQFFIDGLPAQDQRLWQSPWGNIGICICYDLSYTRVTDRLVSMGAQALIVPTMDAESWGQQEHDLAARIAPVRAAEYRLPIARIASSGISQILDPAGRLIATAPFPGPGQIVAARLPLAPTGHLPLDRLLAPLCTAATLLALLFLTLKRKLTARRKPQRPLSH